MSKRNRSRRRFSGSWMTRKRMTPLRCLRVVLVVDPRQSARKVQVNAAASRGKTGYWNSR